MAPLAWIRRVASVAPELTQSPFFDWSQFTFSHLKFRPAPESHIKLGHDPMIIPIDLHPLGPVFWLMSREDLSRLTSWLLKPEEKNRISSELLQEGFYRFLLLQALEKLQSLPLFDTLTLKLGEEEMPDETAHTLDVEISHNQKSCWGRLAIPHATKTAWVQHFSKMPSEYVPTELAKQTPLTLSVKTGIVQLSQPQWASLQPGDFVLLDTGGYDARKGTGLALLNLKTTPLFNVKIKHNKIELLDYAFHHEEPMEKKEDEIVALKELPLTVTVEIARLKITLDELMHLTPGKTLELPIDPDQGVSLTIQGQKVGRAELLHLGEKLGIRILEIG
jgi:type III secretion system YscQ/HrcQ family protein